MPNRQKQAGNMTDYPLPYASQDLTGQVALVTGATSGLGWRFSQVLANAGAKVVVGGRRKERLDELVALIQKNGGEAAAATVDMTDSESIIGFVEAGDKAFGTPTILVNNAGIPDAQRATKMPIDLIDRVFDTNLRGPFVLATEVARRLMDAKKPGRMVNISSAAAFLYSGEGAALYSVTKAGIVRMTEALAVEWARFNINVNAIAPGAFQSEMMDGMLERVGDISKGMPRKRICDPALLDSSLLFLCSSASEAVTGTVIRADDGQNPR
ncbi:SDR family NAD(P)-dependent oxidoreductase [Ponticaulis profundi]|uniref:SDR family NAD(P)-dependent oxidoreductase n=2 Tax=Ponticaulis profundi TaxID=2665222 RepID=A0ABW1S7N1_9PROT